MSVFGFKERGVTLLVSGDSLSQPVHELPTHGGSGVWIFECSWDLCCQGQFSPGRVFQGKLTLVEGPEKVKRCLPQDRVVRASPWRWACGRGSLQSALWPGYGLNEPHGPSPPVRLLGAGAASSQGGTMWIWWQSEAENWLYRHEISSLWWGRRTSLLVSLTWVHSWCEASS